VPSKVYLLDSMLISIVYYTRDCYNCFVPCICFKRMSQTQYTVRNYRPTDFAGYVQLHTESESTDRAGYCTSLNVLCEILGRPNCSPEDNVFVAEADGKIIGRVNLTPELGIGRIVLDGLVHPGHRRRGVATELFGVAMQRALSLGVRAVQVSIAEDNDAARELSLKLGFNIARRFLELEMQLDEARTVDVDHVTAGCRHLRLGEEGILTELQNRSFVGTWGYHPGTIEEIAYRLNLSDSCPEGVILVCLDGRPIGYCWTTIAAKENTTAGPKVGRIYMIGVVPEHRGQGLGGLVLTAGLSYLKGRGIEAAELTVDSENREALALYKSVGFSTCSTTIWYEKPLD
jgi:mycothiol synthase